MKTKTLMTLLVTHLFIGTIGFAAGIYFLPILTAPPSPTESEISLVSSNAQYSTNFKKDLEDSDTFHWGEGEVSIGSKFITLNGQLSPGPDYKLYLSPEFIETEVEFNRLKNTMVFVGDISTFDNFVVEVQSGIDVSKYNTVIVWCETFGEFITSAMYRQ